MKAVPKEFKAHLWSYNFSIMDLEKDKKRIITNVLNRGTKKETDILRKIYSSKDIEEVIKNPKSGEWDKKSLNYWSKFFGIKPNSSSRF